MRRPKNLLLRALQNAISSELLKDETNSNKLSRRNFLEYSALAGVGLAIGSIPESLTSCTNNEKNNRIAIIGGGIAGLNAARYLKEANLNPTIYEADKKTGGRIFTITSGVNQGITSEIGAEFIDSGHLEMMKLVNDYKLELKDNFKDPLSTRETREIFFVNGKRYSVDEIIEEFKKYAPKIARDRDSLGKKFDTEAAHRIDQISMKDYFDTIGIQGWLRTLLDAAFCSEYGLELEEQSALNFITLIGTETDREFELFGESDERFNIVGGNDMVIKKMREELKDHIKLEHQLTGLNQKGNVYHLKFANGTEIKADYVLITIPLTVLRNVEMEVKDISDVQYKAIHEMGYGTICKFVMGFNDRIWRQKANTSAYLFNEVVHNAWDSSWMQHNNIGPGAYTIYAGGNKGKKMAALSNNQEAITEMFLPLLNEVYPGARESFNQKTLLADWPNRPFHKGAFACFKVGQWTTMYGVFKKPAGNLYFAGEHCSEEFQGFMNGGAQTGKDAAVAIIKKLKAVSS